MSLAFDSVFCDALSVTHPLEHWDTLPGALAVHLSDAHMELVSSTDRVHLWRVPESSGQVRIERMARAGVVSVYASGQALAKLRAVNLFGRYLMEIGQLPHKVTRVDVACDVHTDGPSRIADVLARGRCGSVALTRKTVSAHEVEYHDNLRPDGRVSGTVYLGSKHAEVRCAVYDKRLERYRATSAEWDSLEERVRYEVRVRNGLPTLRDVYEPTALFYHHASPSLLPRPSGVPDWVPQGEGFTVERAPPSLPALRLRDRAAASHALGTLCELAMIEGAGGLEYLLWLVRDRYQGEVLRLAQSGVKGPMAPSLTDRGIFPAAYLPTAPRGLPESSAALPPGDALLSDSVPSGSRSGSAQRSEH